MLRYIGKWAYPFRGTFGVCIHSLNRKVLDSRVRDSSGPKS